MSEPPTTLDYYKFRLMASLTDAESTPEKRELSSSGKTTSWHRQSVSGELRASSLNYISILYLQSHKKWGRGGERRSYDRDGRSADQENEPRSSTRSKSPEPPVKKYEEPQPVVGILDEP